MTAGSNARGPRIAVIGAGVGGMCMAIRLRQAGFDDITIFEKSGTVGGTWNHNRYPGAACDVQSHLYSLSFAIKKDWKRPYATAEEILEYLEGIADEYALRSIIRLDTPVHAAQWDDECALWRLVVGDGESVEADVVVSAVGMFNELSHPSIDGLDSFTGTCFHSARWPRDHDLTGGRVAVIGSAASAVQFVPEIAKQAGQLHVFQRTANWVLPKDDTPFTDDEIERFVTDPTAAREHRAMIFRRVESAITFSDPASLAASEATGLAAIAQVTDPEVRHKLTPTEPYGCKRPLISNHYYGTFNRPNVELVTEPIVRVTPTGVVTADGAERAVDTIVLGTGFATTRYASTVDVRGRQGRALREAWTDGAQAYLGITTAGFPNLFMLYGPNTNNGSIIFMIECQVAYVVHRLEHMRATGTGWIDVRPEAMAAYNAELQRDLAAVGVWNENCHSGYYRDGGRIVTQWPHTMSAYRDRTQVADDASYEAHPGRSFAATGV